MAGLSKRFCRQACPWWEDESIKGLCGSCHGKYYNCDPDGTHCGDWQCEDSDILNCCYEGGCGDGHDCPRYIDIEFTVDAFVIQGTVCCNATVPLAQQCNGDITDTPYDGLPSGWSNTTGILDAIIYEKTEHKIRLTRSDCGCFWGGYWSSSCNCHTCCCTNQSSGEPDGTCVYGEDKYPNCDDCYVRTCSPPCPCLGCEEDDFYCNPCDPSNPCVSTDNGYASSLDTYGTGDIGDSDGSAICAAQSYEYDPLNPDACGYLSDVCNDWIDDGTPAHVCYTCGNFKPHHIQALFTYKSTSEGSCNSAWVLQIRGLTELTASELGNSSFPSFDCDPNSTSGACNYIEAGSGFAGMGYIAEWEGRESTCNLQSHCTDVPPASGEQSAIPELSFYSCSCPPTTVIESTIMVKNSLEAFHPSSVFGSGGTADPIMNTCVVKDSQGSQPSETWCNDNDGAWSSVCIGKQQLSKDDITTGTCYGNPALWWGRCNWCGGSGGSACCDGWGECDDPCSCGTGVQCSCVPPVGKISDEGMANDIYPCSHCGAGGDPSNNHYSCQPCPVDPNEESKACVPCRISMTPNNNIKPHWE